jgi:hypothetical protein
LQSVGKFAQIVTGTDVQKVVSDGDDAVTIYDLHTNTPAGNSNIAECARVKNGKIVEMRLSINEYAGHQDDVLRTGV